MATIVYTDSVPQTIPTAEQSLVLTESDAQSIICSITFTEKDATSKFTDEIDSTQRLTASSVNDKLPKLKLKSMLDPSCNVNNINSQSFVNEFSNGGLPYPSHIDMTEMGNVDKKHRDMMRKRQLRLSAEYRQQETARSRNRMKMKRSDPQYREEERQRDRQRRQLARKNNPERRALERERDRLYKKRRRNDSKAECIMGVVSHEIIVTESHSPQSSVLDSLTENPDDNIIIDWKDS